MEVEVLVAEHSDINCNNGNNKDDTAAKNLYNASGEGNGNQSMKKVTQYQTDEKEDRVKVEHVLVHEANMGDNLKLKKSNITNGIQDLVLNNAATLNDTVNETDTNIYQKENKLNTDNRTVLRDQKVINKHDSNINRVHANIPHLQMETPRIQVQEEVDDDSIVTVHKIGHTSHPHARVIRIVHISDTHMGHGQYHIPDGDILIHSGDFGQYGIKRKVRGDRDFHQEIKDIDTFFASLPHKYKLFVAGNHETNFPSHTAQIIHTVMKHGIYLQDSFVIIEGVKIYGSPWNNYRWHSYARAFALSSADLLPHWEAIPHDCDIIVTHLPPYGIMDLASTSPWKQLWRGGGFCEECGHDHRTQPFIQNHWGCPALRDKIYQIRPAAHLFGHVHGCNGVEMHNGILFSNAAMKCQPQVNVIDYYSKEPMTYVIPRYTYPDDRSEKCHVM